MMMRILTAVAVIACIAFVVHPTQAQQRYGSLDDPLVAQVLEMKIHTRDVEEMKYAILGKLLDRYAAGRGIETEPAEIDTYIENVNRRMQEDERQWQLRRDELTRELDSANLSGSERQSIEKELTQLNELLDTLSDTAGDNDEEQAARREIAASFIRQWKINRALHRDYGGRIIYQQGGPEPLDAYRQFLQEQAEIGAFRILDKSFETAFWKYYITDSLHSFYPPGSEEEAQAFEMPPWSPADKPSTSQ